MEQKLIAIDIIQNVLQSSVAVGRYRGEEVWKILDDQVKKITPTSLLVVDIRKANPLQYNFCQYAFGPLLKMLQENKNENIPILFQMHEHHKSCFFRGVLKHIDKSLPRSESEKAFVDAGMFTMIMLDGKNEIQYISNLSSLENEILSFVNELKSISEREIIEAKKERQPALIIDSLRSLNKKGFIVHLKNESDQYHSIYHYLKNN
jgi:hypothetical protein